MKWYYRNHITQGASINTSPPPSPELMHRPRPRKTNICGTSPILTAPTRCDFEPCRHIASSLHLHTPLGPVICLTVVWIPTSSNHTLQKVGVGCTYGCGSEKTPAFVSTAHGFKTKYAPDGALGRGAMWKGEPPPQPSPQELTSRLGRGSIQNRGCYKAAAGRSVQGEVGKTLIWIWSSGASWSGGTGIPGAHAGHTSQGAEVWNRQKPGSDGSLLVTRPQGGLKTTL